MRRIPLREPFFLRGRRSVVQRAVILSVVLGMLSAAVGWLTATIPLLLREVFDADPTLVGIPVAWSLVTTVFVYAPLNCWNDRSWLWTLGAGPSGLVLMFLFILWSADRPSDLCLETRAMLGVPVLIFASGLLLIRGDRRHRLAYLLSAISSALPVLVMPLHSYVSRLNLVVISLPLREEFSLAALFGSIAAAISIPWGLPFWWPPVAAVASVDAD
jgi:hypothetical protein